MRTITAEELKQMKERGQDFLLVNTLSEEDFEATHIPDAVNIPQESEDFAQQVEQQAGSKDKPVVVYCARTECQSSHHGAEKLEAAGFRHVLDFEGGAEQWKRAGMELVSHGG